MLSEQLYLHQLMSSNNDCECRKLVGSMILFHFKEQIVSTLNFLIATCPAAFQESNLFSYFPNMLVTLSRVLILVFSNQVCHIEVTKEAFQVFKSASIQ